LESRGEQAAMRWQMRGPAAMIPLMLA